MDSSVIGNREAVVILNPVKYTLRDDDIWEPDHKSSLLNNSDEHSNPKKKEDSSSSN